MSTLTVRNLDDDLKVKLRIRAAQHGVSVEEEARCILRDALARTGTAEQPMGQRLLNRFNAATTTDFILPERHLPRTAGRGVAEYPKPYAAIHQRNQQG